MAAAESRGIAEASPCARAEACSDDGAASRSESAEAPAHDLRPLDLRPWAVVGYVEAAPAFDLRAWAVRAGAPLALLAALATGVLLGERLFVSDAVQRLARWMSGSSPP